LLRTPASSARTVPHQVDEPPIVHHPIDMLYPVTVATDLGPARSALKDCGVALAKLDETCCIPVRSPCMRELGDTLRGAAATLDGAADASTTGIVLTTLEDAGAQVGRLQVGCCAPDRIPLFARILEGLTTAQLAVNKALGQAH